MNAPADDLTTKRRARSGQDLIREECEQMLRIIDAQLADLEQIAQQLQRKRREWAAKVEVQALADANKKAKRAPRGSIRRLILRELGNEPDGLDAVNLTSRIAALLPVMNRHSVTVALNKMAEQRSVLQENGKWRLAQTTSNEQSS